jgi:hypothetical protein
MSYVLHSIGELKDDSSADSVQLWRITSLIVAICLSTNDYTSAIAALTTHQSHPASTINAESGQVGGAVQLAYALIASAQGDMDGTRRHLAKANHLNPYDVDTRLRLTEYTFANGGAANAAQVLRTVSAARPISGVSGEDMTLYQRRLNILVRARLATGHIDDFQPTIDDEKHDATIVADIDDDEEEFRDDCMSRHSPNTLLDT